MTIATKVRKALTEVPVEIERVVRRRYPDFVWKASVSELGQQVPVFMFHSVNANVLERQLMFLRDNGYETLDLESFMKFLNGKHSLRKPSVLLTFDDGDRSWYEIAYPLLQKYQFQAVGFLVPAYITGASAAGPWLSWSEVLEIEQSGVMQFESHTAYHDRVFVSPRLVDFFHPKYAQNPLGLDTPWIEKNGCYSNQLDLGTPLFRSDSRYAGLRRFIDDRELRRACVCWVQSQGGKHFLNEHGGVAI